MQLSSTKLVRAAQGLRAYVTLVRDPSQLGKVFDLRETIADPEVLAEMAAYFQREATGAAALRDRPRLGRVDVRALAAMPQGTLGQAFGQHMLDAGLDPAAIPALPCHDEHTFVDAHLYETHDIWHVVAGFGVDVAGELGLQAFYAAQFPARLALAILSAGLLNTVLFAMPDATARLDSVARGWELGRTTRPLFGIRWAEQWERPLADVRRELGLEHSSPLRRSRSSRALSDSP